MFARGVARGERAATAAALFCAHQVVDHGVQLVVAVAHGPLREVEVVTTTSSAPSAFATVTITAPLPFSSFLFCFGAAAIAVFAHDIARQVEAIDGELDEVVKLAAGVGCKLEALEVHLRQSSARGQATHTAAAAA